MSSDAEKQLERETKKDEEKLISLQAQVKLLEKQLKERRERETSSEVPLPAVDSPRPAGKPIALSPRYKRIEELTAVNIPTDEKIDIPSRLFHEMIYFNFITEKKEIELDDVYLYFSRAQPGKQKLIQEAVDGYLAYLEWSGALSASSGGGYSVLPDKAP
jgi:hypothetical protein